MTEEYRYHLMRPSQIVERRRACSIAWLPIGTIEWHGKHNPVGTDTLQSERMANLCAERGGGLAFPPLYMGEPRLSALMESMAHDRKEICREMDIPPEYFTDQQRWPLSPFEEMQHYQTLLVRCLAELQSLGFTLGILVVGHYPLIDHARTAATQFNKFAERLRRVTDHDAMLAYACIDYLLVQDQYDCAGDHAGGWETSHVMASHPETVDLGQLPPRGEKLIGAGGKMDARDANAAFGEETMDAAVEVAIKEARHRLENPGQYQGHGSSLTEGRWRE